MKRISALLLLLCMVFSLCVPAAAAEEPKMVTILFTHDLHSHFLPSAKEGGGEYGGYARLMTVIKKQKELYPDAILVDAGDFSMGSLFQTAFATSALELRIMGAMGYDVTTFGNHEFDYLPQGLASMLNVAAESGEPVPAIVDANYLPPKEGEAGYGEDAEAVWAALENYGVKDYIILERGGVPFVLFGLTGFDSDDCAPNSGMILEDPAVAAQRVVDEATAECVETYGVEPVVIALSHSGTENGEGEDYELAQNVEGIHLIISGHTHTVLMPSIDVGGIGGTSIVSAGEYGKYLGVVRLQYTTKGTAVLMEYSLIEIDETVDEDPEIAALVEAYKADVEEKYLTNYGMTFDQILTSNPYEFDNVDAVYDYQHESTLGNVFSDAYKWAVEQATGETVDMAVTASGVIRESIPMGNVTVSDIFNAASLGVGTEGELIAIYVTGADLKNAMEVDASVYPLMHSAQLFMSGVEYSFNTSRMIFNKVDYAMLRRDDGTLEPIEDDKLYRIVAGMYMGQMLGSVEETSMGLLTVTPRDAEGNPIAVSDLVNYVVRDENGTAVKEWYAIASYLNEMGDEMDPKYAETDGRKVVYSSLNPVKLLRNANKFTYILLAVLLVLVLLIVLIVRAVVRRIRRKRK
ncbi:MAG: bifunctional metallophosphatase/5'-nucleotidase [Oscillospiraceae bacterium]|nr:bifunctional metallophosphatase/5'-nucleotidase [Oscillospiraceae bacterium]